MIKTILNKRFLTLLMVLPLTVFMGSCVLEENEEEIFPYELAANVSVPLNVPFLFGETEAINFEVGVVDNGHTIQSVTAFKQLTAGGVASDVVAIDVTGGQFNQNLDQLFADVPIDGQVLTDSDLSPGDAWSISYEITYSDGSETKTVRSGYSTSIPFSCPSNIPTDGTWNSVTTQGAFGVFGENNTVTFEALGDGNYAVSDLTGGFYLAFGFNLNQPGTVNDLCNAVSITGAPDAQFQLGPSPANGPGTWNPETETLSLPWYDSGNDIEEITVYTR